MAGNVQGPGQGIDPVKAQLAQKLFEMADIDNNGELTGSEASLFKDTAEAAGLEAKYYAHLSEKIKTTGDKVKADKQTFKNSRAENQKEALGKADSNKNSGNAKAVIVSEYNTMLKNIAFDALSKVKTPEDKAKIMQFLDDATAKFKVGSFNTKEECRAALRDIETQLSLAIKYDQLKDLTVKISEETNKNIENAKDEIKKTVNDGIKALRQEFADLKDAMEAGFENITENQFKILKQLRANGASLAELKAKANELLQGQADIKQGIDELKDGQDRINDNVTRQGEETRAHMTKEANQTKQIQALNEGISMTLMDERLDGDVYRDQTIKWVTGQMSDISGNNKIKHEDKVKLLQALRDMVDTELIISNDADKRAERALKIGGVAGLGFGLGGVPGAIIGGKIAADNIQAGQSDVARFEQAVKDAENGRLPANWKWQ